MRIRCFLFVLGLVSLSAAPLVPALAAASNDGGHCLSPAEVEKLMDQMNERLEHAQKEFSRAAERFQKAQDAAGRAMRGPGEQPREAGPWYRHLHEEEEAADTDPPRSADEQTFLQHMRDLFHEMQEGE